ncbi:FAD-binding oxidoreductase [Pseudoalteromonas sp. PPB1]|uniref:FAD-binding oxidoreductase n=1 Tax=Pseudoalteromonas sp. PPB1 TaxID=2756136 RepID=UPI001891170F|nr:FAD-dependent oxidoreductase [Pseudoalteromonas sp. PPB1]
MSLIDDLKHLFEPFAANPPIILSPGECRDEYDKSRQVFNRRFDFMPSVIVQVKDTAQVAALIEHATKNDIEIAVKSGGHDHEGECVATGKLLIDFNLMDSVNVYQASLPSSAGQVFGVRIQPGAIFENIKTKLDEYHFGIPHGTCQSVAIAGYTMGGGWGPWTRKYGMGCERLVGATIVLGDGSVNYLGESAELNQELCLSDDKIRKDPDQNNSLLWALRGGGGLSYGIVTELVFRPFKLPSIAQSFVIKSDSFPALEKIKAVDIIAAWEQLTAPGQNPNLIGTNLKVNAKGVKHASEISENALLSWQLNGHFGGTKTELETMMTQWAYYLVSLINQDPCLTDSEKQQQANDVIHEFNEFYQRTCAHAVEFNAATNSTGYSLDFDSWDREVGGIQLETDEPAPHKITSRMPTQSWGSDGRKALVKSLQSTLLYADKTNSNIAAYITLGAISGQYYADKQQLSEQDKVSCAFPYQDRPFTIQYQAWWDQPEQGNDPEDVAKQISTRFYENRAQDWIESCRSFDIPDTRGAFISFKDAAVKTEDYFGDSYESLIGVKLDQSQDSKCLFRSRKTII